MGLDIQNPRRFNRPPNLNPPYIAKLERSPHLAVRFPEKMLREIKRRAHSKGVSAAQIVRELVDSAL